jgi:diguanylate cyclase (GGDEF)-like protein
MPVDGEAATTAGWKAAQAMATRRAYAFGLVGALVVPLLVLGSMSLADAVVTGRARYAVATTVALAVFTPIVVAMIRFGLRAQLKSDHLIDTITNELVEAVHLADEESSRRQGQARRQEFESRLANALDMADGEPEVIDVIERSLATTLPERPVELLLADNSHAHLLRMASASPSGEPPGCSVDSPNRCPAARRAQVQVFGHSDDLDACPKLRGRPAGAVSAVCVPVSIMGRTVGVIHATGEPADSFGDTTVQDLGTLAKLAGARIGLLRAMAETQLQASTDSLTGLLNRRSFEQRVSAIRRENPLMCIAIADLDLFKQLNDTYGHETGDRALRLFAQVLSGSVRAQDNTCRHGGEEFAVALTGCTVESAWSVLDGLRGRLDAAVTVAGLPKFTVSLGVVQAGEKEDLPTAIGRADQALFQAKREGRDRVVAHDAQGKTWSVATDPDGADNSVQVMKHRQRIPILVSGDQ